MTPPDRIRLALQRKGMTQTALAEVLGIKQGTISKVFSGIAPGRKHFRRISEILEVPLEWLTVGENPPPWAGGSNLTPPPVKFAGGQQSMALVGVAAAGTSTEAAAWNVIKEPQAVGIPSTWVLVQVTGSSAYPVAYPGQLIVVDSARSVRPIDLDQATISDLDDNVVLVQTVENGTERAYCKRLCADSRSPSGIVFASVDSGRGSPYLPLDIIEMITPVVGVLFEDPRLPRQKGRNRATITI